MTNKRNWFLVASSIFAFSLWVGSAAADESSSGDSPAADTLDIGAEPLAAPKVLTISSGQSTNMTGISDADANVEDNDFGDHSTVTTGDVWSMQANTGGINNNMVNSGNNVIMQNSMPINIYLGAQ